jgi:hypothetical protein
VGLGFEIEYQRLVVFNEIYFSPPPGCLQYFYSPSGRITTFNFGGVSSRYQHLQNQRLNILKLITFINNIFSRIVSLILLGHFVSGALCCDLDYIHTPKNKYWKNGTNHIHYGKSTAIVYICRYVPT